MVWRLYIKDFLFSLISNKICLASFEANRSLIQNKQESLILHLVSASEILFSSVVSFSKQIRRLGSLSCFSICNVFFKKLHKFTLNILCAFRLGDNLEKEHPPIPIEQKKNPLSNPRLRNSKFCRFLEVRLFGEVPLCAVLFPFYFGWSFGEWLLSLMNQ